MRQLQHRTAHQNIIATTNELAHPTSLRAAFGMISAVGLSLLAHIVLATTGYLTFGNAVNGDILKSYPQGEHYPQSHRTP